MQLGGPPASGGGREADGKQPVKSAGRVLDLLELFAMSERPLSLHDIAAALGTPKSSTLMLVQTLVTKGYVVRSADQRYQLDPLYQLAGQHWVGGSAAVVRRIARPEMQALVTRVEETVLLGVLRADLQVGVIDKVVSPRPVRYDTDVPGVAPAYCTALGRAMLAFSAPELIESYLATVPLIKRTRYTIVDPDALRADLAEVRRRGFAVNHESNLEGACSVAAPLLNAAGHVIGGLNVGCVTANFDRNHETITRHLTESAALLNARLGAPPGAAP